ncbi:hypothetical protein BH09BAC2_BH09BAC2_16210 [soil metagenome]
MQETQPNRSRKKFLLMSAAALCSATLLKFIPVLKKKEKTATIKMLAQDGTLVAINKDLLYASGKKITDKELQNWIKK